MNGKVLVHFRFEPDLIEWVREQARASERTPQQFIAWVLRQAQAQTPERDARA